jgi:hypothetical protein
MTIPTSEPFRGLHRVPIPTWRRPFADYFVALLERSPQYRGLTARLAALADAERTDGPAAVQRHFETLHAFFTDQPKLFATLAARPPHHLQERNDLPSHRGETLLQIDLQEANYQILAHHADGALPPTWRALCDSLAIPAWYADSKIKRQQLLGLFDPKLQVHAMRRWTAQIVDRLERAGYTPVYIAHDEVIAAGPPAALPWDGPRVRQRLLREDIVADTHVRTLTPLPGDESYPTLFAVPRHLFFRKYKEIVLREPATILDDLFAHEGGLCVRLDEPRLAELAAMIQKHPAP